MPARNSKNATPSVLMMVTTGPGLDPAENGWAKHITGNQLKHDRRDAQSRYEAQSEGHQEGDDRHAEQVVERHVVHVGAPRHRASQLCMVVGYQST